MKRVSPHLRRILLGSVVLMSVVVTAPALAEPASIKLGSVKGESIDSKYGQEIQILSFSWGAKVDSTIAVQSSDPEEGGEVARERKSTGRLKYSNVTLKRPVYASGKPTDAKPAEPGKIEVPNLSTSSKVQVSDLNVTKRIDKASPMLAEPLPSGSVTIVVARPFVVAKGRHIPMVSLTSRSRTYELQDVDVTGCTALADGTTSCTLTYQSLGQ